MSDLDAWIELAAGEVEAAALRLVLLMRQACPGPHAFTQHRDHRPPWCRTCRRDVNGRKVPT